MTVYNIGFTNEIVDHSQRPSLLIVCSEYESPKQEWLHKSWLKQGQRFDLKLPAYAIEETQMVNLEHQIDGLLHHNLGKLLDELPNGQDDILSVVISEARRHWDKVSSKTPSVDMVEN